MLVSVFMKFLIFSLSNAIVSSFTSHHHKSFLISNQNAFLKLKDFTFVQVKRSSLNTRSEYDDGDDLFDDKVESDDDTFYRKRKYDQVDFETESIDKNEEYRDYDIFDDDYDNFFDPDTDIRNVWEWETYKKACVYLPPPLDSDLTDNSDQYPKTILHFIGGTLFGSYPTKFYSNLLEKVAEESNSIIIATVIPVTLRSNPLNHNRLSYGIAKSFRDAYRDVICDEYGRSIANKMKIVGVGHSLGSRIHTVLCTDAKLENIAMTRDANILISFNNYNAMYTVPGVKTLEREFTETNNEQRKRSENYARNGERRSSRAFDGDYDQRKESKDSLGKQNDQTKINEQWNEDNAEYEDYSEYEDDDDLNLEDFADEVREKIQGGIMNIKTALTPYLESPLEFQPTPNELWERIQNGFYRRSVPKTLVVQFDQDNIDQSARLSRVIIDSSKLTSEDNESDGPQKMFHNSTTKGNVDIKFARLNGSHLTPVSFDDGFGILKVWSSMSSLPLDENLQELLRDDKKSRSRKKKQSKTRKPQDMNDLVSTIVRYLTDVVLDKN